MGRHHWDPMTALSVLVSIQLAQGEASCLTEHYYDVCSRVQKVTGRQTVAHENAPEGTLPIVPGGDLMGQTGEAGIPGTS